MAATSGAAHSGVSCTDGPAQLPEPPHQWPLAAGMVDLGCHWLDQATAPFLQVLLDERLLDALAPILGLPFVALRLELFGKGPESKTEIPWHQDTYTTHTGFSWTEERAAASARPHPVTLWVALDDVSCENGGMEMIPGRHRELLNGRGGLAVPEAAVAGDRRVEYRLAAGQAGIHHPLAPHRSCPNRTRQQRRAFLLRLSPWTEKVEGQCGGHPSGLQARVAARGWPEWCSHPEGRYVWLPGNERSLQEERSLNRLLVCCRSACE
uniref:Phytanoyl-CoA dioxygenase n=1 Tax=Pyrodinium bahamense TaxID=73915 RepID=A0A7S0FPD9_9DINO